MVITNGTILEAAGLRRVLGREKFLAVDDVSLSIHPGQVHALLGPNGAGKTTTVRICATLLRPSAGSLTVDGIDAVARPERARARLGVVLGGEDGFYPRSSARDNLLFFADLAGISGRDRHRAVGEALDRVSLAGDAATKVGAYSRGMKQRLHIARALLGSPRLLLLDEPTTGLDPDIALQVRDLVRDVAASGVGILLTSHSMSEIEELASIISVIGAGRIAVCGSADDVARTAGVSQTTTFTLPASASGLREVIAGAAGEDGDVDIRPRGADWAVTVSWKASAPADMRQGEVLALLEGAGQARPVDFVTRPASLEEAYLALADRLSR
ncbi:MAG: ABC transporter ATP-binding protein [Actinomycetaceae bacterium]|nr:ABC transporter ATP-binding protein [Actinomycetaceae bacterium]